MLAFMKLHGVLLCAFQAGCWGKGIGTYQALTVT